MAEINSNGSICLTQHQFDYIDRYGFSRFENPDMKNPSMRCALLELGALKSDGSVDSERLAAIKAAYDVRKEQEGGKIRVPQTALF